LFASLKKIILPAGADTPSYATVFSLLEGSAESNSVYTRIRSRTCLPHWINCYNWEGRPCR